MILINKRITEIIAGYDHILQAETELRSHWRSALITTYAHRRGKLDSAQSNTSHWRKTQLTGVFIGLFLLAVGFGFSCVGTTQENGNLLLFCCGGPLLALLGLLMIGAAGFSHFEVKRNVPRRVPIHPLRGGPLQKGIIPNLRQSWMQGLTGDLLTEIPDYPEYLDDDEKDYGAEGERLFIQQLEVICDQNNFCLVRTMQRSNEDIDAVLIGPGGVWVFEVKHWSGKIYWDDKGWRREQTYFKRGGTEVTKEVEIGESPDKQWVRAASEVKHSLQQRAADVLDKFPPLAKVRGGIVFTHPNAALKIQAGRPIFWGSLPFWIKTLQEFEPIAELDTRSALQLVEVLLERHHELAPGVQYSSMLAYSQNVVQEADDKLNLWVQG